MYASCRASNLVGRPTRSFYVNAVSRPISTDAYEAVGRRTLGVRQLDRICTLSLQVLVQLGKSLWTDY